MNLAPPPLQSALIESAREPLMTRVWGAWMRSLVDRAQGTAQTTLRLSLPDQGAAVALTDLSPAVPEGLYRLSAYLRVTRAATSSSSVAVSVTTTDGGVTCLQSGAAVTGNTTDSAAGSWFVVRSDSGSPVSFSTAYASVGATSMQYRLDLVLEAL